MMVCIHVSIIFRKNFFVQNQLIAQTSCPKVISEPVLDTDTAGLLINYEMIILTFPKEELTLGLEALLRGDTSAILIPQQSILTEASPAALSWANGVRVVAGLVAGLAKPVLFVNTTFAVVGPRF